MTDALILTLALDPATQARMDALRLAHFPDRGYRLPAHLTLFHQLPGDEIDAVGAALADIAADIAPFPLHIPSIMKLGGGSAYLVDSDQLKAFRATLKTRFADWIIPQDQHFKAHITVQNKVTPEQAAETRKTLQADFTAFHTTATGLHLWHYRGGPWDHAATYPFGGIA